MRAGPNPARHCPARPDPAPPPAFCPREPAPQTRREIRTPARPRRAPAAAMRLTLHAGRAPPMSLPEHPGNRTNTNEIIVVYREEFILKYVKMRSFFSPYHASVAAGFSFGSGSPRHGSCSCRRIPFLWLHRIGPARTIPAPVAATAAAGSAWNRPLSRSGPNLRSLPSTARPSDTERVRVAVAVPFHDTAAGWPRCSLQ